MDVAGNREVYRYWVELRERCDGSVRTLPLSAFRSVHLGGKRGDPVRPDEQVLRLEDGSEVIEARDLEDLKAKLRAKYPDETHQRLLRMQRDFDAERRRREALEGLVQLLAEAAAREVLDEQGANGRA